MHQHGEEEMEEGAEHTILHTYRVKGQHLIDLLSSQDGSEMEVDDDGPDGPVGILTVDTISFPRLARMTDKLAAEKKIQPIAGPATRDMTRSARPFGTKYMQTGRMEEGVEDFIGEVEDEELTMEADMEPETADDDDDMDLDDDQGDDMEDRVVDLEDAIEELKAEFQELMDQIDQDNQDGDNMESDEESDEESDDESDEESDEEYEDMGDADEDEDEDEDEDQEETLIREYTEKAPAPVRSEHGSVNKKSIVAKKNDMGGTTASIVAGGEAKGRTAPTAKPVGVNDPKAAGRVAFKSQAPKPVTKEVAGVNKDSVLESRKPRNRK